MLHKEHRPIEVRESLVLSGTYIGLGLAFGAWVWWYMGAQNGMDYYTGFMIEKSLSMDNVFVIALIFTFFAIPRQYQHRVLFWGILGVIVLRAIMIGVGAALVMNFAWVLYVFAVILIATGVKMLLLGDKMPDIEGNPILRLLRRILRITPELHQERFFVRQPDPTTGRGVLWVTPLFVALAFIEFSDNGLDGARVIDLYAGSGALGYEALSRGASFALFVETDDAARGAIRRARRLLGVEV